MSLNLPTPSGLEARHTNNPLSEQALAACDHLIVALPVSTARGDGWPDFLHGKLVHKLLDRLDDAGPQRVVHGVLPDVDVTGVSAGFVPAGTDTFATLQAARRISAGIVGKRVARVAIITPGFDAEGAQRVARALVRALAAAAFQMPSARHLPQHPTGRTHLKHITVFDEGNTNVHYHRELAEAEGNGLARWLAALPSNELSVSGYLARVEALAGKAGWEMNVMRTAELAQAGAHAYLAVAQGSRGHSESEPALIHLRYRPRGIAASSRAELAIVGKGICFDTGGVNVKTAQHMQTMNEDMSGSAVALGTLQTITKLGLPIAVDVWLALAENAIGPAAYKPQDLITAANGTTIEVVHTDAEGRMVLADTLHLAARELPSLLIDLATLTGACVSALTTTYSGVFVNRPELQDMMMEAGRRSGERVWPFPTSADYDQGLESDIADVKQCNIDGRGDHILAARFLGRFVPDSLPWVHIDLAASRHKGGLAHVPTDITGFGVHLLTSLLVDQMLDAEHES